MDYIKVENCPTCFATFMRNLMNGNAPNLVEVSKCVVYCPYVKSWAF